MLKQARMIDPSTRLDEIRDILISDHVIVKSGEDLSLDAPLIARAKGEKLNIIDCRGLIAAPGLVDVHVHLREPGFTYKEDIASGASAAAAGGVTTIIAMANTKPPLDNAEEVLHVLREGRKTDIHVYTCATITKGMQGQELVDMKQLKDNGAAGFTDDGLPLMDAEICKEAMRKSRVLKMPLSFHEEDPKYVRESGVNHGRVSEKMGLHGAEARAEYTMVERDCKFAKETGATISIQHISAKESVEAVRKAKRLGVRVFAEASPHHFSLTEDAVLEHGTLAKMNPPLRTEEDRQAIIEGLKDNTIDIIATDHAPHSAEEKAREFTAAPSGIIGLETSLSLGIMNLVDAGHLSMMRLLAKMTHEPAKLYALDAGTLKDDAPADIVLFDPDEEWIYEKSCSKSVNSPWMHKKLKGKVKMTICGGRIVYVDGESPKL